jgi:glycosyltransferase involved in cell wall biosynthesis
MKVGSSARSAALWPLLGGSARGELLRDLAPVGRRRPGSRFAATMLAAGLGRVELTGTVPDADMPKQYADATVLLFTSVRDTFGDQVLEAWAAGLPTVSFAHQGVGDFCPPLGSALVGPCPAARAPARFAAALAHARRHTLSARTARAVSLYEELLAHGAGGRSSSRW